MLKRLFVIFIAVVMAFSVTACNKNDNTNNLGTIKLQNVEGKAKNVILMIGDGMGPVQIKAGEIFKGEKLTLQGFPYMTTVETRSVSDAITDSAASSTAMATGKRTINGYVGKNPALEDLETIVDIAHNAGKRTGIIATEELYGATPMGFFWAFVKPCRFQWFIDLCGKYK